MVNKKFWLGILVMVLVFGMTVISCETDPELDTALEEPGFSVSGTSYADSNPSGIRVIAYAPKATHYTIYYNDTSTRNDGYYEVVTANDMGNGVYWFTDLLPNKTYYFWVKAWNRNVVPNGQSGIAGPRSASFSRN
jgi:hypothetical protein